MFPGAVMFFAYAEQCPELTSINSFKSIIPLNLKVLISFISNVCGIILSFLFVVPEKLAEI